MLNKGMPFYKIYSSRHGPSLRYEVWKCVDVGGSAPLKLSIESSFNNYEQATRRAELDNEEEMRARTKLRLDR